MMYWMLSLAFAQSNLATIPVCQVNMEACEEVYTAEPRPTRNPTLYRFADPILSESQWVPVHIARLTDEQTSERTQFALISLLTKHDLSEFGAQLQPLVHSESAELRAEMVSLLPRLDSHTQELFLTTLSSDDDWLVREQTFRIVARHYVSLSNTERTTHLLWQGLSDTSSNVRLQAVKGLGWNDIDTPISTLTPLLTDADAMVRLHTLRTLERLHPGAVLKLPMLNSLLNDPNPKVQREIIRIQATH